MPFPPPAHPDDAPADGSAGRPTPTQPAALPPRPGPGDVRASLRTQWAGGASLAAGRALVLTIPEERQPVWAAATLALLAPLAPPIAGVEEALALAAEPARWPEAYDLALALGAGRARAERTPGSRPLRAPLLGLAECVAQLAYHAAGGLAPFDDDRAARVAVLARQVVERAGDPALEGRVWRVLGGHA